VVFIGLAITSAWGNGHATTYRALLKALHGMGCRVLFLERDVPWYARNRDPFTHDYDVGLYHSLADLNARYREQVAQADAVVVGSYVPDGAEVVRWMLTTAKGLRLFYDIDTPVTLARLAAGEATYIDPQDIPKLDAYLSFAGGPALERIEQDWGARNALPLYCSVDPALYAPGDVPPTHDLGYLGTFSADRQDKVERLLIEPARAWPAGSFVLAGPSYPEQGIPPNLKRIHHVSPGEHAGFYGSLRFTLNLTRADMVHLGHAPSVRLFEAAACGVPILSDAWEGMETIFRPGEELLLVETGAEVLEALRGLPEPRRRALGEKARARVLGEHTGAHRARQLLGYIERLAGTRSMGHTRPKLASALGPSP
jgi:spore maturation protein CgeB